LADTARGLSSLREVRAVVCEAVQKGRCPISLLTLELSQGPKRGSALLRAALAEVTEGIRSVAEADFRDLLKRSGLPMPMFNARLLDGETFLAAVDAWWEEAGVAAEVDSREWHLSADDWEETMRRHDRLIARGVLLLHFPPKRLKNDSRAVVNEVRAALDAGARRPPLSIRTLPAAS
jgi:hypothetical protein